MPLLVYSNTKEVRKIKRRTGTCTRDCPLFCIRACRMGGDEDEIKTKLILAFMIVMILPTLFTTVAMTAFAPKAVNDIQELYLIIVFCTASALIFWIYRTVSLPLAKLQAAARNIKEGNLDFEIKNETNDEIGQLCQDFEEMRLRLKANAEEKVAYDKENKELISNISHDLKTPITAIKGYVEGIMDGVADTPEKMDRYIKTIYNKANEMDLLINELTFYSKIDTNRIPYNFTTISDKAVILVTVQRILFMELEAKGVQFRYRNYLETDSKVIVDPEQLRRVISNIVGNSVKYMDKSDPSITMDLKDVGDFVQIELGDNGKGIAAKDLPNIFDRFYRTDASRNSSKGGSGSGFRS